LLPFVLFGVFAFVLANVFEKMLLWRIICESRKPASTAYTKNIKIMLDAWAKNAWIMDSSDL